MKLGKKIISSLSSLLAVSIPFATAISCGDINSAWTKQETKSLIEIKPQTDLIFKGIDGQGSFKYEPQSGMIGMLSQARAKIKIQLARYKNSTSKSLNWEKPLVVDFDDSKIISMQEENKIEFINKKLSQIQNLRVQDKIKIEITSPMKGYKLNKIEPFEIPAEKLKYNPLEPSKDKSLISNFPQIKNHILYLNLDNYEDKNLNDLVLSIAKGIGMLMSDKINVTLGSGDNNFKPEDLFQTIKTMSKNQIEKIAFCYTGGKTDGKDELGHQINGTFNLNFDLKQKYIEILRKTEKSLEEIFNKNKTMQTDVIDEQIKQEFNKSKIKEIYTNLFEPINDDFLKLISNIRTKKDIKAISNLHELALSYSDIFINLKKWDFLKDWVEKVRLRNLDKLDSILFSTILRK